MTAPVRALVRVQLHQKPGGFATVNPRATEGATIGVNVWNADGSLYVPDTTASAPSDGPAVTLWSLVLEIPANVLGVADMLGDGFVRKASNTFTASALDYADLPTAGAVDGDGLVFAAGAWGPGDVASEQTYNRIDGNGDIRIDGNGDLRISS